MFKLVTSRRLISQLISHAFDFCTILWVMCFFLLFFSTVRKCIFADVPRMDDRSKLLDLFRQGKYFVLAAVDCC